MSVDRARLQRRLEGLRRDRSATGRPQRAGEVDPEIRRAIAAVVAAGDAHTTPQPVWADAGSVDAASLAA